MQREVVSSRLVRQMLRATVIRERLRPVPAGIMLTMEAVLQKEIMIMLVQASVLLPLVAMVILMEIRQVVKELPIVKTLSFLGMQLVILPIVRNHNLTIILHVQVVPGANKLLLKDNHIVMPADTMQDVMMLRLRKIRIVMDWVVVGKELLIREMHVVKTVQAVRVNLNVTKITYGTEVPIGNLTKFARGAALTGCVRATQND